MALRVINIGSSANDGTGDKLRTAMEKTKNNFSELFSLVASTTLQNRIYASPVGADGVPSFRALSLTDIPTTGATTGSVLKYDGSNVVWGDITNAILQTIYPVGSFYMSATSTSNPNTILGFGTWVAVEGRVIVGRDATQTEFDTLLETGGAKTHSLTEAENGQHSHATVPIAYSNVSGPGGSGWGWRGQGSLEAYATSASGSGSPHNNLQPYLVASIWRRTS